MPRIPDYGRTHAEPGQRGGARLPTAEDIPGKRSVRATRPISNITALAQPVERAVSAQGRAANIQAAVAGEAGMAAEQLADAAANIESAFGRIQNRRDAVERARSETAYRQRVDAEFIRYQTERDMADPEVAKEFAQFQKETINEVLKGHKGSNASKGALAETLTELRGYYSRQAATAALQAQQAQVAEIMDATTGSLAAAAYENPSGILESFASLDKRIDTMAGALTPAQETEYREIGRAMIAERAVWSFLDAGQWREAAQVLNENPVIAQVMDPQQMARLQREVGRYQHAEIQAATEARRKLNELTTILGRTPTPAERARYAGVAAPVGEKTVTQKLSEIESALGRPLTAAEREKAVGLGPVAAASPQGKIVSDRQMFVNQYGEGSEQVKAFDVLAANPSGPPSMSDIAGQRKEFTRLSGDFVAVRDSFNRIAAAGEQPSAAGDLALMFNYMKMLDPNSVVRESEFAQVAATGSFGERLQAGAQRFLEGQRLSEDMRRDFIERADLLMRAQLRTQIQLEQEFRGLAARSGMDPDNVVIDFVGPYRSSVPNAPAAPSGGSAEPVLQPAVRYDLEGNRVGE